MLVSFLQYVLICPEIDVGQLDQQKLNKSGLQIN